MALYLGEEEVEQLLPMERALAAVEAAFRDLAEGRAANRPRRRIAVPGGLLHVMAAAWPARGVLGLKAYTTFRGGRPHFTVLLYSARDGQLLAVVEADRLGQRRTGAATGVAVKYLAGPGPHTVGLLGAGWQAEAQLEAVAAVRPVEGIRVYSPTPERRRAFADRMARRLGLPVEPVETAEAAVRPATLVITATTARRPVLEAGWLRPAAFVAAVGSNFAEKQELPVEVVEQAALVVVDDLEQAREEAGDLVAAAAAGRFGWERAHGLAAVVRGDVLPPPGGVVLFESQGIALEDVAAGWALLEAAREAGAGRPLPVPGRGGG